MNEHGLPVFFGAEVGWLILLIVIFPFLSAWHHDFRASSLAIADRAAMLMVLLLPQSCFSHELRDAQRNHERIICGTTLILL